MIKEHEGTIYKISRLYAQKDQELEDLYQEIVLQIWKAFPSFKGQARVSTWLYRVALNTAITQLRRRKRKVQTVPIGDDLEKMAMVESPEDERQIKMLYRLVGKLEDVDKGIILLYLEDRSHKEIAEIIGLSISNVGTRLNRIKEKLKNQASQIVA